MRIVRSKEVFRFGRLKPVRFRFKGIVSHKGKLFEERLGFRRNKVVEVKFFPIRKRR